VLCDTHDTSILTVDTDVTIPVSPRSRYTAVYRRTNNYRETRQLHASIVSIADAVHYSNFQNFKVRSSNFVVAVHIKLAIANS